MRRRLVLVFLAVSSLVAIAFVVPLAVLVRSTAEDRAIDLARADTAAVVPTLVADGTRSEIEFVLSVTRSWQEDRITVITWHPWTIGAVVDSERVEQALASGASAIGDTRGGVEVVTAVASGPGEMSAIRVFVPTDELRRGLWRAWAVLALIGSALVAISVVVADRLARTVVRPTQELADAARRLGNGELDATVHPNGPNELVELAGAFNTLGSQVTSMIDRERELVAELSHRMRTPLTKLRMRIDQVDESELALSLRDDLDDVTNVVNELIEEARGAITAVQGCDLNQVVSDRAAFWQVLAEDQHRPWQFAGAARELPVAVSASALAAAIDALVENIFAHTPEGSAISVAVAAATDGPTSSSFGELVIGDAGPGIAEGSIRRGESAAGSTGLGLDIARRLADAAQGTFQLGESDLGGAKVVLRLPLVIAAAT